MRNDEQVQEAARRVFEGIVPERHEQLEALWRTYAPRFNILMDTGPDGLFVLDAGAYRDVRFNHRAMRAFWLASFIAWEGYRAIADGSTSQGMNFDRFNSMINCFDQMLTAHDPESVTLPAGVPDPGMLPDGKQYPQARAAAELAIFATGWALLHEVRHLQQQQEGTSAGLDALAEKRHAEEFSCDAYATKFMLERGGDYAKDEMFDAAKVRQKREIGIYFALFAMTLIGRNHWGQSDSHPPMQSRIDSVMGHMSSDGTRAADAIAHAAFAALWTLWPDAPGPFKARTAT